jgi:6-phosphogluconate dehydrogenase
MKFGMVGLGRMGGNLARQAMENGHHVVGYNQDERAAAELSREGLEAVRSLADLVARLPTPRITFLYVPHGAATEAVCQELLPLLDRGDIVVDGGNSHWTDSQRRCVFFGDRGVRFLDVGTSGGMSGARNGACFMAGGDRDAYDAVVPILRDLAADDRAVVFVGESGTGHFSKLVHNAIEFGMVQSIAEGLELLQRSGYQMDLVSLLDNWNHGSVIRSWLVELMKNALEATGDLAELSTFVEDTDEVKWVLSWALDADIPTPVITHAQQALMQYRDLDWPAAKAVALLRNQFGGHPVRRVADRTARA